MRLLQLPVRFRHRLLNRLRFSSLAMVIPTTGWEREGEGDQDLITSIRDNYPVACVNRSVVPRISVISIVLLIDSLVRQGVSFVSVVSAVSGV